MTKTQAQVLTLAAAAEERQRRADASEIVVFTNGCYDLLHPGHIDLLERARQLGDALYVGINSDDSVRRLKGPARPLIPEAERAEVLAALRAVSGVIIFHEDTPFEVIARMKPDVLVKGADWGEDAIVGRDTVEAHGGRVVRLPLMAGYSTTALLARVRANTATPPSAP